MSAMSWPIPGQMTGGSSGEHHLDFKPADTSKTEDALRAAAKACELAIQQIPQEADLSQELLGEGDAVTITERDMKELQPEGFLGNFIVDFYIRYLERRLSPEHGKLFYFFNSFFFTKLLQSTTSTGIDPCKVDYEQLRSWTKEVNLFDKDYVFIPILKSSHWSLVIICHLSSLTRAPDEMTRFPCIVHLDPIKGQHESFEGLIRSYVLQAWMERFKFSIERDQLLALYQMKYVQAKVPRQGNSYDCGLYVLNYIKAFLMESTSPNFSFASSERGLHFVHQHFATKDLVTRGHIQNLVGELRLISQDRARKCRTTKNLVQELMQASQNLHSFLFNEGYSRASIKNVQPTGPTVCNGEVCEINHASNHEDAMDVQHQHSTLILRGNNESLGGPQIGHTKYENRSESLSSEQQLVESMVHIASATIFNGQSSEAKHESTHENSIDVQHQQSSGMSRLDFEPLDGPELQHAKYQRVTASFPNKMHYLEPNELPCMDLFGVVKGKNKRGRNMTEKETWVLLSCKVGGHFCKVRGGATDWDLICEEIRKELGSMPSADQCRLRYDTLLKAYKTYKKYFLKIGKTFSEITEEERRDLKLATTLSEEWYTTMDKFCTKGKSQKQTKSSSNACNNLHPLSSLDSPAPNPPPIFQGRSFEDGAARLDSVCGAVEVALRNVIPASVFNSLNEDLQCTLLNLVQECSVFYWLVLGDGKKGFSLDQACQRLAILQDRESREILNYVFQLWQLDFVNVEGMAYEEGKDLTHVGLWKDTRWFLKLWVWEVISQEVLCKNTQLNTYCNTFPIEQSSLQYIRVLALKGCEELEHLDLSVFPNLQSLTIWGCSNLNLVTGWEVATGLSSLDISWCDSYCNFLEVQYLLSLKEIKVNMRNVNKSRISWLLHQLSQCVKLQRLEIWFLNSFTEGVNLENLKELKFLEYLSLGQGIFSSIQGLSGLQALTKLHLSLSQSLKRVPELRCLKALSYLDMSYSSVEDIVGVEELHLLISLDLRYCRSLNQLPFLGHLKALVYLDLRGTSVKEIPDREDLINVKNLYWCGV